MLFANGARLKISMFVFKNEKEERAGIKSRYL